MHSDQSALARNLLRICLPPLRLPCPNHQPNGVIERELVLMLVLGQVEHTATVAVQWAAHIRMTVVVGCR